MMSSQSRILANLSSKENMSPSRKRSSEEAFSSNVAENISKRRTVDSFMLPVTKSKLFSSKSSNKKQASIKSYYHNGLKEKSVNKIKIFDENKEKNTKKVQKATKDDAFSIMCDEEAPDKYWELLAEERRKGLDFALKENKELADEIKQKDETIQELRTEVDELKETAKHAEYLASVLEELGKDVGISDDEEECSESDSNNENEVYDEKDISISYPGEPSEEKTESENDENPQHENPVEGETSNQEEGVVKDSTVEEPQTREGDKSASIAEILPPKEEDSKLAPEFKPSTSASIQENKDDLLTRDDLSNQDEVTNLNEKHNFLAGKDLPNQEEV